MGGVTGEPSPPPSFKSSCLACHGEDVIQQQRLTSAQWDAEINKMVGWGAKVPSKIAARCSTTWPIASCLDDVPNYPDQRFVT